MGEHLLKFFEILFELIDQFLAPQKYLYSTIGSAPNFGRISLYIFGVCGTMFIFGCIFSLAKLEAIIGFFGSKIFIPIGLIVLINCFCLCVSTNNLSPDFPNIGINFYEAMGIFLMVAHVGVMIGSYSLGVWSIRETINTIVFGIAIGATFLLSFFLALFNKVGILLAIVVVIVNCVSFFIEIGKLLLTYEEVSESDFKLISAGIALLGITGVVGLANVLEPETMEFWRYSSSIGHRFIYTFLQYDFSIFLVIGVMSGISQRLSNRKN